MLTHALLFLKMFFFCFFFVFFLFAESLCKKLEEDARIAAEARAVTGVLG